MADKLIALGDQTVRASDVKGVWHPHPRLVQVIDKNGGTWTAVFDTITQARAARAAFETEWNAWAS